MVHGPPALESCTAEIFKLSFGTIGHKINLVGWISIFLRGKKRNGMERNGTEDILHVVRVLVFIFVCTCYVLGRDINLFPSLSHSQIRNTDLGAC